jgi:hypothetical protein
VTRPARLIAVLLALQFVGGGAAHARTYTLDEATHTYADATLAGAQCPGITYDEAKAAAMLPTSGSPSPT